MSLNQFKVLALFCLISSFCMSSVFAQKYGIHPFDSKKKPFNLGFQIGLNYNMYNLKEQINICEDGSCVNNIEVIPKLGLRLGMIANLRLADFLSLRAVPGVSLEQRDFNYNFAGLEGDSLVQRKIEASYFNLPIMLQWKTKYWKRTRLYVLTGVQAGINLNPSKKVQDDKNLLKITSQDVSLVLGVGLNIYGERVKLSPELKYTAGIFNVYEPLFTSHANAISTLHSQVLTLIVNFE